MDYTAITLDDASEIQSGDLIAVITCDGVTWGPHGPSHDWQVEQVFTHGQERFQRPGPQSRPPANHHRVMYANSYTDIPFGATVTVYRKD